MSKDSSWRSKLIKGDEVEIYSESNRKWFKGEINKIFHDEEGEWLVIWYSQSKQYLARKEIQRYSEWIRPIITKHTSFQPKTYESKEEEIEIPLYNGIIIGHIISSWSNNMGLDWDKILGAICQIIQIYLPIFCFATFEDCLKGLLCEECFKKYPHFYPWIYYNEGTYRNFGFEFRSHSRYRMHKNTLTQSTTAVGTGLLYLVPAFCWKNLLNDNNNTIKKIRFIFNINVESKFIGRIKKFDGLTGEIEGSAVEGRRCYKFTRSNISHDDYRLKYPPKTTTSNQTQGTILKSWDFVKFCISDENKVDNVTKLFNYSDGYNCQYWAPYNTTVEIGFSNKFKFIKQQQQQQQKEEDFIGIELKYFRGKAESELNVKVIDKGIKVEIDKDKRMPMIKVIKKDIFREWEEFRKQDDIIRKESTNVLIDIDIENETIVFNVKPKGRKDVIQIKWLNICDIFLQKDDIYRVVIGNSIFNSKQLMPYEIKLVDFVIL